MCIFDYGRHVGRHGVLKREYLKGQKEGGHEADALPHKDLNPNPRADVKDVDRRCKESSHCALKRYAGFHGPAAADIRSRGSHLGN